MNSYASNFPQDEQGIEESKILNLTSVFNNKNNLEFLLNKEKRFFKFSNTKLTFYVDIPGKNPKTENVKKFCYLSKLLSGK